MSFSSSLLLLPSLFSISFSIRLLALLRLLIGQGGTLGNPKRGREGDDEEGEEGEIPTVKKRKGFSMF